MSLSKGDTTPAVQDFEGEKARPGVGPQVSDEQAL